MSVFDDIREAMAGLLSAIPGLQTSGYLLANPTLPCAQVSRGPVEYDQTMGVDNQLQQLHFTVTVYVALVSDIGGQQNLDKYLDPTGDYSVKQALEADHTLGGIVQDMDVISATGEQPYARESGGPVLGSDWTVSVLL